MTLVIHTLITALAIIVSAYLIPGVKVHSFTTAILVAIVLGLLNVFIKPLLIFLTLPVTILTLGLFLFVINAFIILMVGSIVPGFRVDGFWWAVLYSIVLSLVSSTLYYFAE